MREPSQTGGGNLGGTDDVAALGSVGLRRPGSENERRAARHLEHRLGELGRELRVEPTRIRPQFALTHLIHAVAGVVASVLSVYVPAAGFLLALATTVSAFGDLTGTFHLVRLLTPARASQNVVSDEDGGKPGVIVLVAHYDAPPAGMLANRRLATLWPKALLGALAVITLCSGLRLLGLSASWLTLIQFIPTVVLITLTPAFADTSIAEPADDPADNAAGVAAALRVLESHSGRLDNFDLMVVFTGGSAAFGLGMREWLRRHRRDLNPVATAVISIDNLERGQPAVASKEGAVFAARMHPTLMELAREAGAESYESKEVSDAYLARSAGLPALRISTKATDDATADPVPLIAAYTGQLLERIDAEIGPLLD